MGFNLFDMPHAHVGHARPVRVFDEAEVVVETITVASEAPEPVKASKPKRKRKPRAAKPATPAPAPERETRRYYRPPVAPVPDPRDIRREWPNAKVGHRAGRGDRLSMGLRETYGPAGPCETVAL